MRLKRCTSPFCVDDRHDDASTSYLPRAIIPPIRSEAKGEAVRGGSGSGGYLDDAGTSRRVNRFRQRPGRARNFGMLGAASALVLAVLAAGHNAEASPSALAMSESFGAASTSYTATTLTASPGIATGAGDLLVATIRER